MLGKFLDLSESSNLFFKRKPYVALSMIFETSDFNFHTLLNLT